MEITTRSHFDLLDMDAIVAHPHPEGDTSPPGGSPGGLPQLTDATPFTYNLVKLLRRPNLSAFDRFGDCPERTYRTEELP
jgi:hypothetical protein